MRNKTKAWLMTAASLVLVGCIMFVVIMSMSRWDFRKVSTEKYETNNYEISEAFDSVSIKTDTASVVFVLAEDGKSRVECSFG